MIRSFLKGVAWGAGVLTTLAIFGALDESRAQRKREERERAVTIARENDHMRVWHGGQGGFATIPDYTPYGGGARRRDDRFFDGTTFMDHIA